MKKNKLFQFYGAICLFYIVTIIIFPRILHEIRNSGLNISYFDGEVSLLKYNLLYFSAYLFYFVLFSIMLIQLLLKPKTRNILVWDILFIDLPGIIMGISIIWIYFLNAVPMLVKQNVFFYSSIGIMLCAIEGYQYKRYLVERSC